MALTRTQILQSLCPTCRANSGEVCRRASDPPEGKGSRASFHQDRRTYTRLRLREKLLMKEIQSIRKQLDTLARTFLVAADEDTTPNDLDRK